MSCSSCSTGTGAPKGCKNNGTCGTSGCNKLTVFDWLSNMQLPEGQEAFPYVEVRFKNSRKEYFKNDDQLPLKIGDTVATEAKSGHDIGQVTLTGELVRVQMKRKRVKYQEEHFPKIYRIAGQNDIDKWQEARDREEKIKVRARQLAIDLRLKMKISDIEFQGDASKATFYYTADERVDFRELIRLYASEFRTRIEMKQIGLRQEASRLGGIGSCGRELCCSTWLTDFRSVTTGAARYQNLSLNPQKLAGQCGKLKCCLNYELDSYMDALKSFPKQTQKLYTEKGNASCQKIDIFKGLMWYCYEKDWMNWHVLTTDQVKDIIAKNRAKETVASLEEFASENIVEERTEFENVVGQDSLTRFDQPKRTNKKRRRKPQNKTNRPDRKTPNTDKETKPRPPRKKRTPRSKDAKTDESRPSGKNTRNNNQKNRKPKNQSARSNDTQKQTDPQKSKPVNAKNTTGKPKPNNRNKNNRRPKNPSQNKQQPPKDDQS